MPEVALEFHEISARVIAIGAKGRAFRPPFFRITSFGRALLKSQEGLLQAREHHSLREAIYHRHGSPTGRRRMVVMPLQHCGAGRAGTLN